MNQSSISSSSNVGLEQKFRSMLDDLPVSENRTLPTNNNNNFEVPVVKKNTNFKWILITTCILAVVITQVPKTWWMQTFENLFGIKHIKDNDDKLSKRKNEEEESDNEEDITNEVTLQDLDPLTPEEMEDENFQAIESN